MQTKIAKKYRQKRRTVYRSEHFIFGQGLFRACVVCLIFMPNQNGFFLSYLMLVPVLNIQYKFLTAASFLTAVLYVRESVL
jgi:hypothetical protein